MILLWIVWSIPRAGVLGPSFWDLGFIPEAGVLQPLFKIRPSPQNGDRLGP